MVKRDIVQVQNPKSGHYVKIDRHIGNILSYKKREVPYKNVQIAKKRIRGYSTGLMARGPQYRHKISPKNLLYYD